MFATDGQLKRGKEEGSCGREGGCCRQHVPNQVEQTNMDKQSSYVPHDNTQEPIFPPELNCKADELNQQPLVFKGEKMTWFRPSSLKELLQLKRDYPEAKLVVGNTELGIEMKFKKQTYPVMIQPSKVQALQDVKITDEGLLIGNE